MSTEILAIASPLNKIAAVPGLSLISQTTILNCDKSEATPVTGLCNSILSTPIYLDI
jgi:hypothetical protein